MIPTDHKSIESRLISFLIITLIHSRLNGSAVWGMMLEDSTNRSLTPSNANPECTENIEKVGA